MSTELSNWHVIVNKAPQGGYYVDVAVAKPNSMNAVQGILEYNATRVKPDAVEISASVIKLWPKLINYEDVAGQIRFLGIVPGGVAPELGTAHILRVHFTVLEPGEITLRMTNGRIGHQYEQGVIYVMDDRQWSVSQQTDVKKPEAKSVKKTVAAPPAGAQATNTSTPHQIEKLPVPTVTIEQPVTTHPLTVKSQKKSITQDIAAAAPIFLLLCVGVVVGLFIQTQRKHRK